MPALNRIDLDLIAAAGCQCKECKGTAGDRTIFFVQRCCAKARTDVSYTLNSGVLRVACRVCDRVYLEVAVSP